MSLSRCALRSLCRFPARFKSLMLFIMLGVLLIILLVMNTGQQQNISPSNEQSHPTRTLYSMSEKPNDAYKTKCRFYTCFDINLCALRAEKRIGVNVYEHFQYVSSSSSQTFVPETSDEYFELLSAIKKSRYYEPDEEKACVFVPALDTLSQNKMNNLELVSAILDNQPRWHGGENHLIFNMLPGTPPHYNTTPDFYYGKAMLAGGSFTRGSYRSKFDISLPVFNSFTRHLYTESGSHHHKRTHLLTVLTHGWYSQSMSDQLHLLTHENGDDVLLLETDCPDHMMSHDQLPWKRCNAAEGKLYPYLQTLSLSQFCLLVPGLRLGSPDFLDMLMTGCIPVVLDDHHVLPFSEVLDWSQASVRCWSHDLVGVASQLRDFPLASIQDMREKVLYLHNRYFASVAKIAITTLDILNERVFPTTSRGSEAWTSGQSNSKFTTSGADLDLLTPAPNEGFTAVILTYSRVTELFDSIRSLAAAPSLVKILVVWNNVEVPPPPASEWPRVKQPIQVIRSKFNRLSNRFFPYPEIQTSAVFSLDDDITMLTADELEFGYKAWQEFPNRLVGFPGRVHTRESSHPNGKWRYESSWLNNISLVLTGAAFYHNYYNYLYTYEMPSRIRDWVDSHMNCEDIAMNFLIANHTSLPPLKISARKKFTCPNCATKESLWNDPEHYLERDECVNIFERFFDGMPLQTVKFRLDPVLYKEPASKTPKMFPGIGEL